ncbi:MAG: nucleoid-associated protein [Candidatus Pedobacter colombiensis]|uniref:Nucleoid-associated protein n=1 Tax=Candidatus Pedobacter colombiensis TaxID=3121371 RepID=A0AAJ6B9R2_9SPHI|nr:nucleoid-associated protein [Pedobacter sp.]WEK20463.1 MAG: nucleoid-associated protein [Pedobacter sp.]
MVELLKKGHNLSVSNIIVHKLNKEGGNKITKLKLAKKELLINDQEIFFVADVRKTFQNKSHPIYGIFDDSLVFNGFKDKISQYRSGDLDFLSFTHRSMELYELEIKKSAPATGAFMVFADYILKDNGDRYILLFSINNNDGYNLSEDLTIKQILNLDLSKLDVAAQINLTRWEKHTDGDNDGIKSYLSFIKGKKNLSDYFLDFIGCADKSTNSDSSQAMVTALHAFLTEKGFSSEEIRSKKKIVYDYCRTCIKDKREVRLSQISYLLDEEEPNAFSNFASSEDYRVSEVVKTDTKVLKSLHFVDYRSNDLTLIFNTDLITNKRIDYNSKNKTLLIKDLPEELIKELEQNVN